jgi:hypothetical protein
MINLGHPVIVSRWQPSIFRPCGLEHRARRTVAAAEGAHETGPYSSADVCELGWRIVMRKVAYSFSADPISAGQGARLAWSALPGPLRLRAWPSGQMSPKSQVRSSSLPQPTAAARGTP